MYHLQLFFLKLYSYFSLESFFTKLDIFLSHALIFDKIIFASLGELFRANFNKDIQ